MILPNAPDPSFCWMTPWLSSHSRRLSEASSITVAPLCLASWTASDPTPPVAPDTTTTSQADVPTPLTGCQPSVPGYRVRPPQLDHRAFRSLWSELRPGRPPAARPNGWKPAASRSPDSENPPAGQSVRRRAGRRSVRAGIRRGRGRVHERHVAGRRHAVERTSGPVSNLVRAARRTGEPERPAGERRRPRCG